MTDALKRYELFGWDYTRYSPLGKARRSDLLYREGAACVGSCAIALES